MKVAYGIDVLSENDPFIDLAIKGVSCVAAAARPGA